ncbi:MAG TPA: hypothetical protein VLG46_10490 [Anaerolineae bacterium]|nr:hypothetical protein [Anaerolineae bacterium]
MKSTKLIIPPILAGLIAFGTLLLISACNPPDSSSSASRLSTRATLQASDCPPDADVNLMIKTQAIIQRRLSGLGLTSAKAEVQGACQLVIDLPSLADPAQMLDMVRGTGLLELVDTGAEFHPQDTILRTTGNPTPTIPSNSLVRTIPDKVYPTIATGADFIPDELTLTLQDNSKQAVVVFELETTAAQRFKEFTTRAVGSYLCIVLDNAVQSCPRIQSPIPDGKGVITVGSGGIDEAQRLLNLLRSGFLPYELEIIQIESLPTESESKP